MERIDYFKVFGFLAFTGSAFLSAGFHYPVFTIIWFFIMLFFMISLCNEKSEMTILAISALAYVPLGLIAVLEPYLSKTPSQYAVLSNFAGLLSAFALIELCIAIAWLGND